MNKISGNKNKAVVKVFIKTFSFLAILFSTSITIGASKAKDTKTKEMSETEQTTSNNSPVVTPFSYTKSPEEIQHERELEDKQSCGDARSKVDDAVKEIGDACKRAALGDINSCVSKAKSCGDISSSDSFNTFDAFGTALGLPPGQSISGIKSACPQMNGRDYFSEKDKLEKEIKDTQQQLADLNDDKAKFQDDYNKEMQTVQEDLNKAQEDYKQKSRDIDQKNREQLADFNNNQNQTKDQLRKIGAQILNLRGQLIQSQRDKALKLLAMTEASGKRACMKAVNDAKKSYDSVSSDLSASHISQAQQKRTDLINIYYDCMDAFDQQRIALNESKKAEQDQINKQINDYQSQMDDIQNSLNLSSSQLQQIQQAAQQEKSDSLQSVVNKGNTSQQAMNSAYTKLQTNLQTLAAKTQNLTGALNRTNQSLMTLGPAPKRSAEDTAYEASSTISAQVNILEGISGSDLSKCTGLKDEINKKLKIYKGSSKSSSKSGKR
ncbi:MAG: hypothetical protein ACXVCY_00855 [Pseudobdellovibrionaceae bacterium]